MKSEIKIYQRETMNKSFTKAGMNLVAAFVVAQFICVPAIAEVSKEGLDSISTPDRVETSISMLEFLDGAPLPSEKGPFVE